MRVLYLLAGAALATAACSPASVSAPASLGTAEAPPPGSSIPPATTAAPAALDDEAACRFQLEVFRIADGIEAQRPSPRHESEREGLIATLRRRVSLWNDRRGTVASPRVRAVGEALAKLTAERADLLAAPVPPALPPPPPPKGESARAAALREASEFGMIHPELPRFADFAAEEKNREATDQARGAWLDVCSDLVFRGK